MLYNWITFKTLTFIIQNINQMSVMLYNPRRNLIIIKLDTFEFLKFVTLLREKPDFEVYIRGPFFSTSNGP